MHKNIGCGVAPDGFHLWRLHWSLKRINQHEKQSDAYKRKARQPTWAFAQTYVLATTTMWKVLKAREPIWEADVLRVSQGQELQLETETLRELRRKTKRNNSQCHHHQPSQGRSEGITTHESRHIEWTKKRWNQKAPMEFPNKSRDDWQREVLWTGAERGLVRYNFSLLLMIWVRVGNETGIVDGQMARGGKRFQTRRLLGDKPEVSAGRASESRCVQCCSKSAGGDCGCCCITKGLMYCFGLGLAE